jgi:hypothetical protein
MEGHCYTQLFSSKYDWKIWFELQTMQSVFSGPLQLLHYWLHGRHCLIGVSSE